MTETKNISSDARIQEGESASRRWLRFTVGAGVLTLTVMLFASGYSPPGACGEVLRHNQVCDIDASPLFYTEVENMSELERGLADLRFTRDNQKDNNETDADGPTIPPAETHQ